MSHLFENYQSTQSCHLLSSDPRFLSHGASKSTSCRFVLFFGLFVFVIVFFVCFFFNILTFFWLSPLLILLSWLDGTLNEKKALCHICPWKKKTITTSTTTTNHSHSHTQMKFLFSLLTIIHFLVSLEILIRATLVQTHRPLKESAHEKYQQTNVSCKLLSYRSEYFLGDHKGCLEEENFVSDWTKILSITLL